ncbi:MAG: nucleotidyltransferase family protein [Acidimicrobiales bacterium]
MQLHARTPSSEHLDLLVSLAIGQPLTKPVTAEFIEVIRLHRLEGVALLAIEKQRATATHDVRSALAMDVLAWQASRARMVLAVEHLVPKIRALGIEPAIAKGLAIEDLTGPGSATRPAVDIDLFIEPAQVQRIGEILDLLEPEADHALMGLLARQGWVFEETVEVLGVDVDVHRDILNCLVPSKDPDRLWSETSDMRVGSTLVTRPNLELAILISLLHLARDGFSLMLGVHDLIRLFDREPEWAKLRALLTSQGLLQVGSYACATIDQLAGRSSPLSASLKPSYAKAMDRAWPHNRRWRGQRGVANAARTQNYVSLFITDRRLERAKALKNRLLLPNEVLNFRYPQGTGSYPSRLVGWRMHQREQLKR